MSGNINNTNNNIGIIPVIVPQIQPVIHYTYNSSVTNITNILPEISNTNINKSQTKTNIDAISQKNII